MKVELIVPIARLHDKLNGKAPYYFKTINGKTYVQRCPKRTAQLTPKQIAARERFAAIAQKDTAGGKTTFKAYLWKVCGDAYDAQH